MKKKVAMLLGIVIVGSYSGAIVHADSFDNVSGGWSESKGYYIDGVPGSTETYSSDLKTTVSGLKFKSAVTTLAANTPTKTPNKHTGQRVARTRNNVDVEFSAIGETVWYYKYHYTTARMELSNGTVKTTSGRQWGMNATRAQSPYYLPKLFENTEARTYWGS